MKLIALALGLALVPSMASAKCWGTKHDLRSGLCQTLKEARKAHPRAHLYYTTRRSSPSPSLHGVDPLAPSGGWDGKATTRLSSTLPKAHPSPWIIGTHSIPFINIPGTSFRYRGPDSVMDVVGTRFGDSPWWWRYKYPRLHVLIDYPL